MSDIDIPRRGLSVAETGHILGVHPDTVRNMIERGELRARQTGGKGSRVVVFADSIEKWFAANEPEVEPEVIEATDKFVGPAADVASAKRRIAADLAAGLITSADAVTLLRALSEEVA